MEKYASSYESRISIDCSVEFNKTRSGQLHIKIKTFKNSPVVLKEETLAKIIAALNRYNDEVTNGPEAS